MKHITTDQAGTIPSAGCTDKRTDLRCQRTGLALLLAAIPVVTAHAHTTSIGYENSGNYQLTFWYGSYHGENRTEGDIRLVGPNMDEQGAFDLLVSSRPLGLDDGTTNFYSGGSCTTLVDYNCFGSAIDHWQGREFGVSAPGEYTFTYVPIANPTLAWEPINDAILSSTLRVITADLDIVTPTIGLGQTEDQTWQQPSGPVIFEGGTLALTDDAGIDRVVSVDSEGGTIDTAGHNLVYTGAIDGRGLLTKTGEGTLFLEGTNSNTGGLALNGGIVHAGSDAQFGAAAAGLSFDGGTLQFGDAFDIDASRSISLGNAGGTIDTQSHETTVAQAITGTGDLSKTGSGTLNLRGNNTFGGDLEIGQGTVDVEHDGNLGSGNVVIGDGALRFSQGAISNRDMRLDSALAVIDTINRDFELAGNLTGPGTLNKSGTGVMTLSGANSQDGINLHAGAIEVTSASALGQAAGTLGLGADTRFGLLGDMTVTQQVYVAGANARLDTGDHDVVLEGQTAGDACLTKTGTGHLDLRADGSNAIGACIEEGRMSFNANFAGDVWVEADGIIGGSGTIHGDVEVAGVFSPGNSPGITTVHGSVTHTAGSTLEIEIDGPNPGNGAGFHDQLLLFGGDSVFTAAGTLDVLFRGISGDANNDYTPEIGATFSIVEAEGGIAGRFDTFDQPADGLPANSRLDIGYWSHAIVLGVTPEEYATTMDGLANANGRALAVLTDTIRQDPGMYDDSGSGRFQAGLMGLTGSALATTFEQAAGSIHASTLDATARTHGTVRNAVRGRMMGDAYAGYASTGARVDGAMADGAYWWGQAISDSGRIGDDRNARGYRTDSNTILIGRTARPRDGFSSGFAVAFSETEASGRYGTGDATSYMAMAYGKWQPGRTYASGIVGAGVDEYDIRRSVDLSSGTETVSADAGGTSVAIDTEVGHVLTLARLRVTPAVGLAYTRMDREAVTEDGNDAVAIDFSGEGRDSLEGRVGAHVDMDLRLRGASIRPYVSAFGVREFLDEHSTMDPELHGEAFTMNAPGPGGTRTELGVGLRVAVANNIAFDVSARADESDNASSSSVGVGLNLRW